MNSQSPQSSRVVVLAAVDGTATSEDVVATSTALCQTLGAELHLVHVAEPTQDPEVRGAMLSTSRLIESSRGVLDANVALAGQRYAGRIVGHLAAGYPTREVLQLASELQADLIVVGPHRKRAVERWLLGSISEQIVRKASCAVLVARAKEYSNAVPEIEPPCPDCVALQSETGGARLWCAQHDRTPKHVHAHLHYETPQTFAVGSMLIRPEG